jgi:hypothetical protein
MLPLHQWCLLNGGALSQIIVYYFYRSNKKLKRRGRMCASPNKHYFDKHRQNNVSDFLDFQEIPSFRLEMCHSAKKGITVIKSSPGKRK